MTNRPSALAAWTPEQIAQARGWVETWRVTGVELERIARQELQQLDTYRAIEQLYCDADFSQSSWAPLPTSGLIEMQRLFMELHKRQEKKAASSEV